MLNANIDYAEIEKRCLQNAFNFGEFTLDELVVMRQNEKDLKKRAVLKEITYGSLYGGTMTGRFCKT